MNRLGDAAVLIAVDASTPIGFTYETDATPPVPIDVTGYSARSEFLIYDGTRYGAVVYEPTVTVGTTDGLFSVTLTPAQLAALLEQSPTGEPARFRVFITPGGGDEFELAHGSLTILSPGAAVAETDVTIVRSDFTVSVNCIGSRGPQGIQGEQGEEGPAGGIVVQDGSTTINSITPTVIRTLSITINKNSFSEWRIKADRSGDVKAWRFDVDATDVAGVVTLRTVAIVSDPGDTWGTPVLSTGTSSIICTVTQPDGTSTVWSVVAAERGTNS